MVVPGGTGRVAGTGASEGRGMATAPDRLDEAGRAEDQAHNDLLGLGIIIAAVLLFVANGSTVLADFVHSLMTGSRPREPMLGTALILNIALLLFG